MSDAVSPPEIPTTRTAPKRINFTVKALEALAPPSTGRIYVYDNDVRGLAICITAANARTYYLYRWVKGRPERIRLGKFDELTIDQARKAAGGTIVQIVVDKKSPQQMKAQEREGATFGELFTAYIEKYKKPHRPKSWRQDQNNYDLHLKHWANRKLADITPAVVQALHTSKGADHPYLANRLLALISTMFNKAGKVGISYVGENPAEGVTKFAEKGREMYLSPDAMPAFFAALNNLKNQTTADFFKISLYTGQRRANVQAMRWEQVDLERGIWKIPDTKANRAHMLPLEGDALTILKARRKADPAGVWVFPSHSATGHIVEPKKAWKSVLKAAGLVGYRVHDLRHTLGSWMGAAGTPTHTIAKQLGHSQTKTTEKYVHVAMDTTRRAVAGALKAIKTASKVKPKKKK